MAHLLIANGTQQHIDFQHRVPAHEKVFSTLVPAGRQIQHPVDMDETQLAAVVRQLERYGARPASDVGSLTSPRGLVFSVNRPVVSDKIDEAREKDEAIRQQIAEQEVENAGVAIPTTGETGAHLKASTLEVKELEPTTREQPVKGGVDMTVKVSRDAGAPKRTKG